MCVIDQLRHLVNQIINGTFFFNVTMKVCISIFEYYINLEVKIGTKSFLSRHQIFVMYIVKFI